jgi:hypothetical protein
MFVAPHTTWTKSMQIGRVRSKCGQAVVEYILIVAAITGAFVMMKNQMMSPLMGVLDEQAQRSIAASADGGRIHYRNGCSRADGGGLCN